MRTPSGEVTSSSGVRPDLRLVANAIVSPTTSNLCNAIVRAALRDGLPRAVEAWRRRLAPGRVRRTGIGARLRSARRSVRSLRVQRVATERTGRAPPSRSKLSSDRRPRWLVAAIATSPLRSSSLWRADGESARRGHGHTYRLGRRYSSTFRAFAGPATTWGNADGQKGGQEARAQEGGPDAYRTCTS